MMKIVSILFSIITLAFSFSASDGHEVVEVENGAAIEGVVTFKGNVPGEEIIATDKDTGFCGKRKTINKYIISDNKVKNVVVWIEGIERGKAISKKDVEILLKNCQAGPLVNIGFVGGKYIIKNEDDILHTIQLKLGLEYQKKVSERPLLSGATIYNLAFPKRGVEIKKPIKKYHKYTADTGFVQITSNAHNWIRGYIFIFDHPYAAVTGENGSFTIDDLPAGEYLMKIWHEGFGITEKRVKLSPGESKEIEIEFSKEGATSQNHKGDPAIKFSETKTKFGNVKKGEIISCDFGFVNEGDGVLRIVELIPA